MLNIMFTSIPDEETEPDLGLFGYGGDDVSSQDGTYSPYYYHESMDGNKPTHRYSPIFLINR